jgi:hypothetical protein
MDYETADDFLQKPKETKISVKENSIDKRQLDYLKKLKTKLESGVNVRIIPKTKQALKDLFGIDADRFKIKKNSSPFNSKVSNVEDEEVTDDVEADAESSITPSINNNTKLLPSEKINNDDKLLLNKLIDEYLFKNIDLIKDAQKPKEVVVIHKHYHYNAPNVEKVEEDEEGDEEGDEEDTEENANTEDDTEKELQFSKAFLDMVTNQVKENLSDRKRSFPNIKFM